MHDDRGTSTSKQYVAVVVVAAAIVVVDYRFYSVLRAAINDDNKIESVMRS